MSRQTFCFRACLRNKEMQHLLPVLWEAGKHQHGPGNLCRCISHSSSAKGAVSLGINYLAINPIHWIRLLGVGSLCVCAFLYGFAYECVLSQKCALCRSCPSCLSLTQGGREDLRRFKGTGIWPLQLSVGFDLGCQGNRLQKAKTVLSFQRLGCFFSSANQGERQTQVYWLSVFVLFLYYNLNDPGNRICLVKKSG